MRMKWFPTSLLALVLVSCGPQKPVVTPTPGDVLTTVSQLELVAFHAGQISQVSHDQLSVLLPALFTTIRDLHEVLGEPKSPSQVSRAIFLSLRLAGEIDRIVQAVPVGPLRDQIRTALMPLEIQMEGQVKALPTTAEP